MKAIMKSILIILLTLIVFACSGPKDKVIPSDMSKWETELKPSVDKLKEDERKLFVAFILRAKFSEAFGAKLLTEGMTVGKAIDEQKKWVAEQEKKAAEQKALQEEAQIKKEAASKQVGEFLKVSVISMKLVGADIYARRYQDRQDITIEIKNTGSRDILGVRGKILFIDIFDKQVGSMGFSFDDGVKAGATATWKGSRDYNQFMPEHRALANLEPGKYKTVFEPDTIVFSDGTKLTLE